MNKEKMLEICKDNEFDLDWNCDEGVEFRSAVKGLIEKQHETEQEVDKLFLEKCEEVNELTAIIEKYRNGVISIKESFDDMRETFKESLSKCLNTNKEASQNKEDEYER